MTTPRCTAGSDPALCCTPGAWQRLTTLGIAAIATLGEPLPEAVITVAAERNIDPHTLDWHVEAVHGWEPHDEHYPDAVTVAADCLAAGGCE